MNIKYFDTHIEIIANICSVNERTLEMIASLIPKHVTVVLRNQSLTAEKMVSIIKTIGYCYKKPYFACHENVPEILNVTNKRDSSGKKLGIFADFEVAWHTNGSTRKNPEKFIALYCKKPGVGGDTYFSNGYLSYRDLPEDIKRLVHEVFIQTQFDAKRKDSIYKLLPNDPEYKVFTGFIDKQNGRETTFGIHHHPLVRYNDYTAKPAVYFCYPTIQKLYRKDNKKFDELSLWNYLKGHLFQKKYVYHHKWRTGDLIFNDQSSGLHRRDAVRRELERHLYRIAFNLKQRGSFHL